MRIPPFQYLEPESIVEALSMMDAYRENVKIIAGGTEVINHLKRRIIRPAYVMNVKKIRELDGISAHEDEIVIGANVSLKEIKNSPLLHEKYKAIAEAAFQVAAPPLTNMGTIGGNLLQDTRCKFYNQSEIVLKGLETCHKRGGASCLAVKGSKRCFSVYQGDMAPALVAFDAKCVLKKRGSTRIIPIIDLFTGNGIQPFSIENREILTEIIIPKQNGLYGSAYKKLRIRGSIDYPLVSAALLITITADMKVDVSRIVIGAAGPAPIIVNRASSALQGRLLEDADCEAAADMAYELSEGVDNLTMPGAYRRKMVRVLTKKAIRETIEDIKRGM